MFGLYNTAVRVPLLLRLPGGARAGEVDSRKGQLVDLFATLLGAAGLDSSAFSHRGLDLMAGEGEPQRQSVFSEYYYPAQVLSQFSEEEMERQAPRIEPYLRRMRAIQRYGFRFIWSSNGRHELYDLRADPGETRNLYSQDPRDPLADEFLALLQKELALYVPESSTEPSELDGQIPELDSDTLEALRAVGYVQ
jgi:arylsulfatase A-like enzyme